MFTVYLAARFFGRQRSVLPPLALAATVMLALSPEIISSISFQLSFAAVLGIALFSGRIAARGSVWIESSRRIPSIVKRPTVGIFYGMSVSVAATVATAPLVAFHFGIPMVLLVSSQSPTFTATPIPPTKTQILGIPTPQQMMRVVEGMPFTVPPGKIFVATGLSFTTLLSVSSGGKGINLNVDNIVAVHTRIGGQFAPTQVVPLPGGLTASAGSVLDVGGGDSGSDTSAWGYLADA